MDEFRTLFAARTGWPERRGVIAQAAKRTGVKANVISRWLDPEHPVTPSPANLELAPYLEVEYDDLLLMVYGRKRNPPALQPLTPQDRALRTLDALAGAVSDLRTFVMAMASASQPNHAPRTGTIRPRTNRHYVAQAFRQ